MDDKVPAELKETLEGKVKALREALTSDDIEVIRTTSGELESSLAELYNAAQQATGAAGGAPEAQADVEQAAEEEGEEPRQAKGKVVDAEVVDAE